MTVAFKVSASSTNSGMPSAVRATRSATMTGLSALARSRAASLTAPVSPCGGEVGERSGEVDEVGQGDNEGSGMDDVTLSPTTIALRVARDGGEGGDIDAHLDAVLAQLDA